MKKFMKKILIAAAIVFTVTGLTGTQAKAAEKVSSTTPYYESDGSKYEGWRNIDGRMYRFTNGMLSSQTGIDVSTYQGVIDWEAVKQDDIKFAIIRIGYGDDDTSQDDRKAIRNMNECERLGIPYGVYIYSYAVEDYNVNSEIAHTVRMLQGRNPQMGVYFDSEDAKCLEAAGADKMNQFAATYLDAMQNAHGYQVGLYANKYWLTNILTSDVLRQYNTWVAQYYKECTYNGNYMMWQYTSSGSVAGIDGAVDMNARLVSPNENPDDSGMTALRKLAEKGILDGVDYSAVYNKDYYYSHNGDLQQAYGTDPYLLLWHFVAYGMSEGRQGCEGFDIQSYAALNLDVKANYGNNKEGYYRHYIDYGKKEGRAVTLSTMYKGTDYSAVYNKDYYRNSNADIAAIYGDNQYELIEHFVTYGINEGRRASETFDPVVYKIINKDIASAYGDNMKQYYYHYMYYGKKEGRQVQSDAVYAGMDYSSVYNKDYYYNNNPDLQQAIGNNAQALIIHFVTYGMAEGREAIATFDINVYKNSNGDIVAAYHDDLPMYYIHYIEYGQCEGRKAK